MVTANLLGGLGNKMFQIATTFSLAKKNKDEMVFSLRNCNSVYQPPCESYLENIFRKIKFEREEIPHENLFIEDGFNYQKITYKPNLRIAGYFQSQKYFSSYKREVLSLFSIDRKTKKKLLEKYRTILESETCSVHVRRTDYIHLQEFHTLLDMSYFKTAMNFFDKKTNFLIFSDDIDWCRNNFKNENVTFIEGNRDFEDLWLMSLCKNNIISNSSFSWWGAFLNKNKSKKVICPIKWFGPSNQHLITTDLYCKEWISI